MLLAGRRAPARQRAAALPDKHPLAISSRSKQDACRASLHRHSSRVGGAAQVRQRAAALLKKFPLAACSAEVQGAAAASEHARGSRRGGRGRLGGAGRAPWGHVEYEPAGAPGGRPRLRFLPGHDAGAAHRACIARPATGSEWVAL